MTKPKRKKKRKRMIAERKARQLTQAQLGKMVGCSTAMISAIESGRVKPGLEVSLQLEVVLETSLFELFPDL